jgi:hypothetical protein
MPTDNSAELARGGSKDAAGCNSAAGASFDPATPDFASFDETEAAASRPISPTGGAAPQLNPALRGKLVMALALGLSQREAERWFDVWQSTVSRQLQQDPSFAAEVEEYALLAMLHPLLRIQQAARKSWRAAAWLDDFLARREGETAADELLGAFPELSLKIRSVLFEDAALAEECDDFLPIGEAEELR